MSALGHDLEQSPAANNPQLTISPSPPRRDAIEDANPSFTRKRPRLDSGSESRGQVSAGPQTPINTTAEPQEKLQMTIRSHPPSSPVLAAEQQDDTLDDSPILIALGDEQSSSPPPIEIVESDDDDQQITFTVQLDAEQLFQRFPFAYHGNHSGALRELAQHIQSAASIDAHMFPMLSDWLKTLPNPSTNMRDCYVSKATFWDDFANLVNKTLARRYRWIDAFGNGQSIDISRYPFGDHYDDIQVDEVFYRFFQAYLKIASSLLFADAELLSQANPEDVYQLPLLSQKHLKLIQAILRTDKSPVFHLLYREYQVDSRYISSRLHKDFLSANGAQNLLQMAHNAFHKVAKSTQILISNWAPQILSALGWSMVELPRVYGGLDRPQFFTGVLRFINTYSKDLFDSSKLTDSTVARDLIQHSATLLFELCSWDESVAAILADEFLKFEDIDPPSTPSSVGYKDSGALIEYRQDAAAVPEIISSAWKFKLLRKQLKKGKMDIRVMSISTMDTALVDLWREHSQSEFASDHPVLRYLAEFLLRSQIVDYIVSVESHPQLISRSGNIVGFLVVNNRWSAKETDAIWRTVSTSPDPRVVTATITMLRAIISLMTAGDQLYLCSKLYEMPIERYTLDILRFARELTSKLRDRIPTVDFSLVDRASRPWNICIKILRDTAAERDTDKVMFDLHNEAINQLRLLLNTINLVPMDESHTIFAECEKYIVQRLPEATGSIKVLSLFTPSVQSRNANFFHQNQDLIAHLIEELARFVDDGNIETETAHQSLALRYWLELLANIICRAEFAIPVEQYESIWDHIVGEKAFSNDARDMAWMQLVQILKLSPQNHFCKQLAETYMPKMNPRFYTVGVYDMVVNYYSLAGWQNITSKDKENGTIQIPGADMLWSMMLSSPPNTIEIRSARLLATRYVQVSDCPDIALKDMEATHVALVNKCMQEMRAASQDLHSRISDSGTPSMNAGDSVAAKEQEAKQTRFGRIVMFQKLLLEYVRQKPQFNRGRRTDSKIDAVDIPPGDVIPIKYQCGNDRETIMMAPDQTIDDLYKKLCRVTGFTKLNLFAKGQRLNVVQSALQTIADSDFGGQLLVQRAEGAEITQHTPERMAGSSVFETTIVDYFDELFAWMVTDDETSKLLFDFLSLLPARRSFADAVVTGNASSESLFPAGKFYQAKYTAQALQSRLREQIRNSTLDEVFLANAVQCLNEALLNSKLISDPISNFQELQLAAVLVKVLLEFLRERPSPEVSAKYFCDGHLLTERLIHILSISLETNEEATNLQDSFAVLLEASLHSQAVWEAFTRHASMPRYIQRLLLTDERPLLRQEITKKIASVCGGDLPRTCPVPKADIAAQFWSIISEILPTAVEYQKQSLQLFELAEHVFRVNDEYNRNEESLRSYLAQWGALLADHQHKEFVGREEVDYVVLGFTKLLLCCIPSLKSFKQSISAGELMERIFRKYLFVQSIVDAPCSTSQVTPSSSLTPVLDSCSRQELYSLMLALAEDSPAYTTLLRLASEVENEDYESTLPTVSVDRSLEIRSNTGYVGLYNPRAICYMNSLISQLFMNVNFRQFMLGLEVQEANGSQKLLSETQRLFAQMQLAFRKCADPRDFAACIKNLEQAPIDISVQMDADEFYNLLFDQWEAQLVKEEQKQQFRSFYGGKTLNQIKSKECEHVSERAETFFAVQCDVQGKANLHESLQAFVQGDVMEGDNKYKCEACGGKFVDAIKRTCLKEVPDNLIFHLKRFEFDLNDFSRRKIYDHFEFPQSIDISEYHVDHVSDPTKARTEDIFELVGVLIHTGTCENGHYYSYIRERPCPDVTSSSSWIEFDDSNVGLFNPEDIAQRAFGGPADDGYNRQIKNFSAYMLFYQRRKAIEHDQQVYNTSTKEEVLQVQVPIMLKKDVDDDNALFTQEYCLFDTSHSRFVRQLHALSRTINHGTCSEKHEQESCAIQIVWLHLSHISWRQQSSDIFIEILNQLRRSALACATCCCITLKTICASDDGLFNVLLKCIHPKIRAHTRLLLLDALNSLRANDQILYGSEPSDGDVDSPAPMGGVLEIVVKQLQEIAQHSGQAARGWEDLYLLLTHIVDMGHDETAVVLNHGMLEFALRLTTLHVVPRFKEEHQELARVIEKKRGITNKLIGLIAKLLLQTDPRLTVISPNQGTDRGSLIDRNIMKFPLTIPEREILFLWADDLKAIACLDKMLELWDQTKDDYFYPGDIVRWMLGFNNDQAQLDLCKTINEGITLDPPFCDAYIQVSLAYCQACPTVEHVLRIITTVAKAISSTVRIEEERSPSGEVVLGFFTDLLHTDNAALFDSKNPHMFYHYLMAKSRFFIVHMLLHERQNVRDGTYSLLRELYGNNRSLPPETVRVKYISTRDLVSEMIHKIVYEKDAGVLRSHLNPLISSCQSLVQSLWTLSQTDDPTFDDIKDSNDVALVCQYQVEVEPRLRSWPIDASTPLSHGDAFDPSDYGSESDDANELLDN